MHISFDDEGIRVYWALKASEVPSLFWIVLAGPRYWKALRKILQRRTSESRLLIADPLGTSQNVCEARRRAKLQQTVKSSSLSTGVLQLPVEAAERRKMIDSEKVRYDLFRQRQKQVAEGIMSIGACVNRYGKTTDAAAFGYQRYVRQWQRDNGVLVRREEIYDSHGALCYWHERQNPCP